MKWPPQTMLPCMMAFITTVCHSKRVLMVTCQQVLTYGMVPMIHVQAAIDNLGGIAVPEVEESNENTILLVISVLI